jgi:hypothetical protein
MSIFGLNYYYSFISDNKVNYSFSWIGDAKKIYNFELQKYVKGEWVSEVGFCIVGNSFNYPIDIKDKIRWRVYEGYDMPENTPWRDLVFYHN